MCWKWNFAVVLSDTTRKKKGLMLKSFPHKIMSSLGDTEQEGVYNASSATHHLQFYEVYLFIYSYMLHTYYLLSLQQQQQQQSPIPLVEVIIY